MKKVSNFLIYALMLLAVAMVPACGIRKVNTDISKTTARVITFSSDSAKVIKSEDVYKRSSQTDSTAKKSEVKSTRTTEEFNPDGSILRRTTEEKISNNTDNSVKVKNSLEGRKIYIDSVINRKIYRDSLMTTYNKTRVVDKDSSWYAVLGGWKGILIIVIAFMLFVVGLKWLREKFKNANSDLFL